MAIGRAERRGQRVARVRSVFDESDTSSALDLLELVELGWHDVYEEITPSEQVVDDILIVSGGNFEGLIRAALLAVTDWRDLRVEADKIRGARQP